MCYVLYTRPIIQITDQHISKQDGIHLSGIQIAPLVFKWNFKTEPFGIQPLLNHLNKEQVKYSDPAVPPQL